MVSCDRHFGRVEGQSVESGESGRSWIEFLDDVKMLGSAVLVCVALS